MQLELPPLWFTHPPRQRMKRHHRPPTPPVRTLRHSNRGTRPVGVRGGGVLLLCHEVVRFEYRDRVASLVPIKAAAVTSNIAVYIMHLRNTSAEVSP